MAPCSSYVVGAERDLRATPYIADPMQELQTAGESLPLAMCPRALYWERSTRCSLYKGDASRNCVCQGSECVERWTWSWEAINRQVAQGVIKLIWLYDDGTLCICYVGDISFAIVQRGYPLSTLVRAGPLSQRTDLYGYQRVLPVGNFNSRWEGEKRMRIGYQFPWLSSHWVTLGCLLHN